MDAFLLYIDDWLGSTNIEAMDAHEERGYLRLLLHAAKQPDCGLPNDPVFLAKLSKMGPRWARGGGEKVMRCFFQKGGKIFNRRLLDVHQDYLDRKDRRRKAADAKWKKERDASAAESAKARCNADAMQMQCSDETDAETMLPTPTPTPNVNTKLLSSPAESLFGSGESEPKSETRPGKSFYDAGHDRLYSEYWRRVDRQGSRKAFEKRVDALAREGKFGTHAEAVEFLVRMAQEDRRKWEGTKDWEWRKNLHPATWLNGSRWQDEPVIGGVTGSAPRQTGVVLPDSQLPADWVREN
jgi:uncharacterized protein YdaU (DUF1376 family)